MTDLGVMEPVLLQQGQRAGLNMKERRHFATMLRSYRATLAVEIRATKEALMDKEYHFQNAIDEADRLIDALIMKGRPGEARS